MTPSGAIEPCARGVCEFAKLISADRRPTLYFLHSLFPHVPYVFLPSSRRYAIDARVIRGMNNGLWLSEWPAKQAHQRYLLQLVHTDRALGHVLDRLRAKGVYERALVIVTADHGVSFKTRDQRRLPTATNLDDIGLVPLFVKLPQQRRGRTDDSFVQTTSILPTIARVLGIPLRWRVQAQPLVGRRLPRDGEVTVYKQNNVPVRAPLASVRALRARTLARQVTDFGSGNVASLYRIGPRRDLVGRPVSALAVRPASGARIELDGASLYDAVDPSSGFLPSFVEGRATGLPEGQPLAVAVNGTIAATTQTFEFHDEQRFAAFVPEQTLRRGKNTSGRVRDPGRRARAAPRDDGALDVATRRRRDRARERPPGADPAGARCAGRFACGGRRPATSSAARRRRPASPSAWTRSPSSSATARCSSAATPTCVRRASSASATSVQPDSPSSCLRRCCRSRARTALCGCSQSARGIASELRYAPTYPWLRG